MVASLGNEDIVGKNNGDNENNNNNSSSSSSIEVSSNLMVNDRLKQQQQQEEEKHRVLTSTTTSSTKADAPKFLLLLYEILQEENDKVIRWAEDGLSLQILDPTIVTEQILPKYFNHNNFHSFQRQLNYFGFRKWTKSKTDICTFSHPCFIQNQPGLLSSIKRKKAPKRPIPMLPTGAPSTTNATKNEQASMMMMMTSSSSDGAKNNMKSRKRILIRELSPAGKRKLMSREVEQVNLLPSLGITTTTTTTTTTHSCTSTMKRFGSGLSLHIPIEEQNVLKGSTPLSISPLATTTSTRAHGTTSSSPIHPSLNGPSREMSSPISDVTSTSSSNIGAFSPPPPQVSPFTMEPSPSPSGSLPTLQNVRNRIVMEQKQQQQQLPTTVHLAGNPGTPTSTFSTFSDPVDILLRIRQSAAAISPCNHHTGPIANSTTSTNSTNSFEREKEIASLQEFLLENSLHLNRLETQLKLLVEENDNLKNNLTNQQQEKDQLIQDKNNLQHENMVLLEDKRKLFEINRELLSKLFPPSPCSSSNVTTSTTSIINNTS